MHRIAFVKEESLCCCCFLIEGIEDWAVLGELLLNTAALELIETNFVVERTVERKREVCTLEASYIWHVK